MPRYSLVSKFAGKRAQRRSSSLKKKTNRRVSAPPSTTSSSDRRVSYETVIDVFDMFDKNRSGRISSKDISAVVMSMGLKPTTEEIHDIIHTLDADEDGKLSFEDFTKYFMSNEKHKLSAEEEAAILKESFDAFDNDKNGLIDRSELKRAMSLIGEKFSEADLNQLMRLVDKNKDGFIDRQEFAKAMMNE